MHQPKLAHGCKHLSAIALSAALRYIKAWLVNLAMHVGWAALVARSDNREVSMYRHILIPTDGSELAEHAVTNGLSLAKSVGAKVSVIIVEQPFDWLSVPETKGQQAFEELAKYAEQIKKHAASVLNCVADAAKQAGVSCETIQVENEQPYRAIVATAANRGCDLIVMASHGRSGLSAVVLGSVTNKVLAHTKTPVLVCH